MLQVSARNRFAPAMEVQAAQNHRTNITGSVLKPARLRFRWVTSRSCIIHYMCMYCTDTLNLGKCAVPFTLYNTFVCYKCFSTKGVS